MFSAATLAVALVTGLAACDGTASKGRLTRKTADGTEYLADELIVRRNPAVSAEELDRALARMDAEIVEEGPASGAAAMAEMGFLRIRLPPGLTPDDAAATLIESDVALAAERNYLVTTFRTPNDPRLKDLWGMTKIGAPAAWDVSTGSANVLVAVSDSGIDCNHPDLRANCWTNPREIADNGVDDDGNGFVDDVRGWDFANNDKDPMDDNGHGTHVAGTIGAVGNEGVGVAGVNWTVKLVGTKFLGASGSGTLWNGAQTVLYAAKVGAKVVNASWGCRSASCYASYMAEALDTLHAAGGLFIAAAGNDSGNNNDVSPVYPANYTNPNVVAVAATDSNDGLAWFSNIGVAKVHLGAPGVGILSSTPNGGYASYNGTSMAAPHVAGAAALYLAVRPAATPTEIKERLLASVDKIPSLAGKTVTGGRLNVHRLLTSDGQAPATPRNLRLSPGRAGEVTVRWDESGEDDLAGYRLRWGTSTGAYGQQRDIPKGTTMTVVSDLPDKVVQYFAIQAADTSGNFSALSAEVSIDPHDVLAPPVVADLRASNIPGDIVESEVAAASGAASEASGATPHFWEAARAIDGNPDSAWLAPPRAEPQEEYLVVRLRPTSVIDRVELYPNPAYPAFFPVDFDVDISEDGTVWKTIGGRRGVSARAGEGMVLTFPAAKASHVRLRSLKAHRGTSGFYYTSVAEMTVRQIPATSGAIVVEFTAPGDDPGAGKASRYDLRWSPIPITEANFAAAIQVPTTGPAAAGVWERITVDRLEPETTYHFALKAIDDAGNVSPLSNVARLETNVVPPAAITDLVAMASSAGAVTLRWTAPGANAREGRAARYELRRSTSIITPASFSQATLVEDAPAPSDAGSIESHTLEGLEIRLTHYFALRAFDAGGAPGPVSNVASARPGIGPDVEPPAAITSLVMLPMQRDGRINATVLEASDSLSEFTGADKLVDGNVDTIWITKPGARTAPAWVVYDLGAPQPLSRLRMHPGFGGGNVEQYPEEFALEVSADRTNWQSVLDVRGLVGQPGSWNEWRFDPVSTRYVRVRIVRRGPGGPESSVQTWIGEIELWAHPVQAGWDVTWIAPGDDGFEGVASHYAIYRSTSPIDESNFGNGVPVAAPVPLPGGLLEVIGVFGLPLESRNYIALVAYDEAGNRSPLSNVAFVDTPSVPPAPVADLRVTAAGKTTMTLAFTASGDDGSVGQATAYDLRYADTPITPESFGAANVATAPAPGPAGTSESVTVADLAPGRRYYFAVRVIDDRGLVSILSNLAQGETEDGTAPAAVSDLVATVVDPRERPPMTLTVAESSGSFSGDTGAEKLLDARAESAWISPARAAITAETVRFAWTGGAKRLSRLRLRAATGYEDLFPPGFRVEVRREAGAAWSTIVDETAFSTAGGWEEWALGAAPAVEARIVVTASRRWAGGYVAAIGDLDLYADDTQHSTLRLAWTAPGDDGTVGTAARYELRRAGSPIDEAGFANATAVSAPVPRPAGALERQEVGGLTPETRYCFAVRAIDEVGQPGGVSNSACADTPGIPPGTVTDLRVTETGAKTVTLAWTAPGGDDGVGRAARYELRRHSGRIHGGNFDTVTVIEGLPTPAAAGSAETFTVTGLTGSTTYVFALRAVDDAGTVAAPSNNARGTTIDDVAPGRVANLAVQTVTTTSGAVQVTFTAPGDSGATGRAARYDLRESLAPIDASNFDAATAFTVAAPQLGGATESFVLTGLSVESDIYVAVKAIDAAGNVGLLSNVATGRTRDEAPAAVSNLAVLSGRGAGGTAELTLVWTAKGDDGTVGRASRYDLRRADVPITATNFAQAVAVVDVALPSTSGTLDRHTVTGLLPGRTYYFALTSIDDRGNVSPLSNVATGVTPDETAPARVTDLRGSTGTAPGTVTLTWTAPGDDGASGTARSYDVRWSTAPIDASNFGVATLAATQPTPAAAGTIQSHVVTGLPDERELYFALRARDDVNLAGEVSNSPAVRTADIAPAQVTSLVQTAKTATSITVRFTAPGDDNATGTATSYDLRYSLTAITSANFAAATAASAPAPRVAGTVENVTITGLEHTKTYYIALRTRDERGNTSALSNVLTAETTDQVAPVQPGSLAARTGSSAGSVVLTWVAPGDDGASGQAARYELRRSTSAITAGNWDAAAAVATSLPARGGTAESLTVAGLTGETRHHFALRAVDEAGNVGELAAGVSAETLPVPPAAVTNLVATVAPGTLTVTLTWTAPGDDGSTGRASSYDVRQSVGGISDVSFATDTRVANPPTPGTAGASESVTITGLAESTTYSFALKSTDDVGAVSAISNVARVTTPDLTRPAAPASLAVSAPFTAGAPLDFSAQASSTLGSAWDASNVADGVPTTAWASEGSATARSEHVILDLGTAQAIDRIRLLPDDVHPDLFPRGFALEVSSDRASWSPVAVEEAFATTTAPWLEWGFGSANARYVRVLVSDANRSFDRHYALLAEAEIVGAATSDGRARLTFIAPGDDGQFGRADRYQLYRHTAAFTEATLASASAVTNPPTPAVAGSLQSIDVTGLDGERTYHWALRAVDDAGNVGPLSAVVAAATNAVAPAATSNLRGTVLGTTSVRLDWTAPGDDGTRGRATSYEIRYAAAPLTSQSFATGTLAPGAPTPAAAGSAETLTVTGLAAGTAYRFALVTRDEAGNASYLSNVAQVTTTALPDTTAPAAVSDLDARQPAAGGQPVALTARAQSSQQSGFTAATLVDGRDDTAWASAARTSNGTEWVRLDAGALTSIDRVRVTPSAGQLALFPRAFTVVTSPDGLAWTTAAAWSASAPPTAAIELSFTARSARYLELRATDLADGGNGLFYAVVAELEALVARPAVGSVVLSFTAPSDDGPARRAASYDLRIGGCPFNAATATAVATGTPGAAGTPERFTVTALAPGTYCAGVTSADAAGNRSAASNAPSLVVVQ